MAGRNSYRTALILAIVLSITAVAQACPNCKETLAGDPAQQGLAQGIYYSILFMMSMPFFIFGSLCAYFYYLVRCDRAAKAKLSEQPPAIGNREGLPVVG